MELSDSELVIREASVEEIAQVQNEHFRRLFANRHVIEGFQQPKITSVQKEFRYIVIYRDKFIGWHVGHAIDSSTYYMKNSAIIEEFQGKGFYTRMLKAVLSALKREGYDVVMSTHHPNNSAVLIPKLKQGFVISGLHFHERFRFVIDLKYFFNLEHRHCYEAALGLQVSIPGRDLS